MTDSQAFDWLAWGAVGIAVGAVVQAVLSSIYAVRHTDPLNGWVRTLAWGAIGIGSVMTAIGAGHFAGW